MHQVPHRPQYTHTHWQPAIHPVTHRRHRCAPPLLHHHHHHSQPLPSSFCSQSASQSVRKNMPSSLQSLFDRCPILPVDASISLGRYLHTIRQTLQHAIHSETLTHTNNNGDRPILLHIRVLQLVCKTIPSHPEYLMKENISILRQLRLVAHTSFQHIERLVHIHVEPDMKLNISESLLTLFQRIHKASTQQSTIGVLATRPFCNDVTALIIPTQTYSTCTDIVTFQDIVQLLYMKHLVVCAFVVVHSTRLSSTLMQQYQHQLMLSFSKLYSHYHRPTLILVHQLHPKQPLNPKSFKMSPSAVQYISSPLTNSTTTTINSTPTHPLFLPSSHVNWLGKDHAPVFKLYDLR